MKKNIDVIVFLILKISLQFFNRIFLQFFMNFLEI